MTVNDIKPHLRFVNIINFEPIQKYCRAPDCHFYYMLDEHCRFHTNNNVYELKEGSVVIVPAGDEYYFEQNGKLRLISINFDYTDRFSNEDKNMAPVLSEEFCESDIIEKPCFSEYKILNSIIVTDNMYHVKQYLDLILREFAYKKQFFKESASSQFKYVLMEIIRAVLTDGKSNEAIDYILNYIHENFSQDLTNTSLASLVGYHPYHLNRLIKKTTGTTLHQYLIDCRIEHARDYLRKTQVSISEISQLCGYKNFCNFSNDFKKKTGLSPVKYRKAVQNMI